MSSLGTVARRPKDRRAQILEAAAGLFAERGFAAVGVDEIAAAVGVSGSALYRHFPGKDALLEAVVVSTAELLAARTFDADVTTDQLVAEAVAFAVHHPARLGTYLRERPRLTGSADRQVVALEERIMASWSDQLRAAVPDLDDRRVIIRRQATIGALSAAALRSRPDHEATAARALLTPSIHALVTAAPVAELPPPPPRGWEPPVSRRDQLLGAAVALFRQRGFHGVGIDEIGEAVGVTGSAVYRHFASKADILVDAYDRAGARVLAGTDEALDQARSPAAALEGLIAAYVRVAIDNRDLIVVTSREGAALPAEERPRFARCGRVLRDTWVAVVAEALPHLSDAEARLLVATALALINSAAASTVHEDRLSREVAAIALAYMRGEA